MSAHLKNFEVQYLNNQAFDHPGSYMFRAHIFTLFQAIVSFFQNCVTSNMTKFESHKQNLSKSLCSWLLTAFSQ